MNGKLLPPAVWIAVAAVTSFYGLYALAQAAYRLSSFVFLGACAAAFAAGAAAAAKSSRRSFFKKTFYLFAGIAIGAYAELSLRAELRPPHTLAELSSVQAIAAELTGEPAPAGADYYRIPARLISCSTTDGAHYSASGSVQLFLPAALIRAGYAGGITRIGGAAVPEAGFSLLKNSPSFAEAVEKKSACRFYVRGIRMLVQGKFGKDYTVFYAGYAQPLFLGWRTPLDRLRAFFRFSFMRLLYEWGDAGGLLLALLAADKAFLSKDCADAFRNAGLAHILALSGMHLSLISAAALQGGRVFGRKNLAVGCSMAAVCMFVWFAGSAPSLNRAIGMLFITAAGRALGLRPPLLSVLCAMLTIHLAVYSADALALGFMLSYGACAGIIIFGDAAVCLAAGIVPPDILQSISASVGAQLFTAPIIINATGGIASAGIIASCIISPAVSLFLIIGLVSALCAFLFPPVSPLLGNVLQLLYAVIFKIAAFFARFPIMTPETDMQKFLFSVVAVIAGFALVYGARHAAGKKIRMLDECMGSAQNVPAV